MKKITIGFVAATVALLATHAWADEQSGLALGLRSAYAMPFGSAAGGSDLAHLTSGAIPLQLDVGYRFDPHWQAGGYLAYGPAAIADQARSALASSGATEIGGHAGMRIGVQGSYTFRPGAQFAPWVGLHAGYEWTRYASATTSGKETELGMRGFDAGVVLGGDYRLSPRFTVGPFTSFSLGQFQAATTWVSGSGETSTDIQDKAIHAWLQLGIRGTFQL